ncbi:outer membrane protein OmpA-like peptidoglycan-associated protein [Pontibacter ummariensis]|uniref:Outer membrane protein OmpA n=1 Tax=Pontibacter ummariensis TaxID=1610492 RepID=A0A239BBS3_9BACT|nr:OmpA family protein [Pontibacter ummariensis]PRY16429.1 outer membrane protein OmpA-like peptidoglycan-associated protein [Pontibacter ummariensis]SNS05001.1 Outer membrane protein OmpA [Pontibacter ummariensis]
MHTKLLRNIAFMTVLLLMVSTALRAQNADLRNNIQVFGSAISYKGDFGSQFWDSSEKGGGVAYNRYLSPAFDLSLQLSYNSPERNYQKSDYFEHQSVTGLLLLRLKAYGPILKEDAFFGPYLTAGVGGMYADAEGQVSRQPFSESFVTAVLAGGAGIRLRFTDRLSIFGETKYLLTGNDKFDGLEEGDNEQFLLHEAGIGYNLGRAADADADGVPDRRDDCPNTPTGVQVDKRGCPIDTDADGVPDYQDECPTEAGTAATRGCPDRDNDGVADKDDRCPDEAGLVALQGCPDADGDGVADNEDRCPDTPAGVQVGADGCPLDADGDGVPDYQDICPNSPGTLATKGCPELDAETLRLIDEKVRFEFDQARVQDAYKQLLDSIVVALQKYPDHVLLIQGHADYIGSEEYNQALSEARAENVKEYLVSQGVQNPERLVTRGYGESRPLVEVNERLPKRRTELQRRINRRVGFQLNTPDLQLDME